jgi:Hypothetical protein (DUF2513)
MQVYEYKVCDMKREMDLIRDLLFHIEDDPSFDGKRWMSPEKPEDLGITGHSLQEIDYHLTLLIEAGFVKGKVGIDTPVISRLTWEGHEFAANIKDQDVWSKTKERMKGLPNIALTIVAKIAEAEIMKRVGLA